MDPPPRVLCLRVGPPCVFSKGVWSRIVSVPQGMLPGDVHIVVVKPIVAIWWRCHNLSCEDLGETQFDGPGACSIQMNSIPLVPTTPLLFSAPCMTMKNGVQGKNAYLLIRVCEITNDAVDLLSDIVDIIEEAILEWSSLPVWHWDRWYHHVICKNHTVLQDLLDGFPHVINHCAMIVVGADTED